MLYEYEAKAKKKPSDKKSSDVSTASMVVGTWSYQIDMPDQKREGTFAFSQKDGEISGTISSAEITSGNNELEDIVLDGNNLSFTYDLDMSGQTINLEFDLKLTEETYEGNVTVKDFGTFPLTGSRTSKPE
jgi:uncharacterized protein YdgA (DUF945 family)